MTIASRFSPASPADPGFEILYLAENHLVAMFEAQALFGSPLTPGLVIPNPTSCDSRNTDEAYRSGGSERSSPSGIG